MRKGIIITLPNHDDVTDYLSQFSAYVLDEAARKGLEVKELKGKTANRGEFEKVIRKLDYKLLVFNGHGSDDEICGDENKAIVRRGENSYLLRERICYARACRAAALLGEESMRENREGCFIGYKFPFIFYMDVNRISNPLRDNIARLFLGPSNLVPISIIKGNSANDAHENSKRQILKNINKVLRNKDKESFLIAEALWNNYAGQVLLGNISANL